MNVHDARLEVPERPLRCRTERDERFGVAAGARIGDDHSLVHRHQLVRLFVRHQYPDVLGAKGVGLSRHDFIEVGGDAAGDRFGDMQEPRSTRINHGQHHPVGRLFEQRHVAPLRVPSAHEPRQWTACPAPAADPTAWTSPTCQMKMKLQHPNAGASQRRRTSRSQTFRTRGPPCFRSYRRRAVKLSLTARSLCLVPCQIALALQLVAGSLSTNGNRRFPPTVTLITCVAPAAT